MVGCTGKDHFGTLARAFADLAVGQLMKLRELEDSPSRNYTSKEALQSFHESLNPRWSQIIFFGLVSLVPLVTVVIAESLDIIPNDTKAKEARVPVVLLLVLPIPVLVNLVIDKIMESPQVRANRRQGNFEPFRSIFGHDARSAFFELQRKVPGIYDDDVYEFIAHSPEYVIPNQVLETTISEIDHASPYTPFKLAKELGSKNIIDLLEGIADEEKILVLLLRSFVNKKGDLAGLNRDVILHILSFLPGSSIYALISKAPDEEKQAVILFAAAHAKRRVDNLPKLLKDIESKDSKPVVHP